MNCSSVFYDEPPPSPTFPVSFDPEAFGTDLEITSPKRKQRVAKGPARKRKKVSKRTSITIASKSSSNEEIVSSEKSIELNGSPQENENFILTEDDPFITGSPFGTHEISDVTSCFYDSQKEHHGGYITGLQDKVDEKSAYHWFVQAVFTAETDFWQLSSNLFIVNRWDRETNIATNVYYHLHMVAVGQEKRCHCLCPEGKQSDECFHIRFIQEHGDKGFPIDYRMPGEENQIFLFSRNVEQSEPTIYRNTLSVPGSKTFLSVKNRAIVEYLGDDGGTGTWMCSKHSGAVACIHIHSAREFLHPNLHLDDFEESETVESNADLRPDIFIRTVVEDFPAVSYKQIPPPRWARISTDTGNLPFTPALSEPPEFIPLTMNSSCSCTPDSRSMFMPDVEKKVQLCQVYGLTRMWNVNIGLQKCSLCRYRFIGPDCQELGLFNWNNRVLLTHDLLDDYTSSYVNSETPFVAWTSVTSRRYETFESPSPFLSEKRFRTIWFAYAQLLELNNDMRCTKCGPTPRVTIWDGVTLAFSRKNLTSSLCPPTTILPTSKVRGEARHPDKPQCFRDPTLRKMIRYVLTGPPLRLVIDNEVSTSMVSVEDDPSDDDATEDADSKKTARAFLARQTAVEHMQSRVEQGQDAIKKLEEINLSLAGLFNQCYGRETLVNKRVIPPAYATLFMQLASEESALQLMTRSVIDRLKIFVNNPNFENASHLNMFPSLYKVVMLELTNQDSPAITEDLLGLCRWVMTRGMTVFISSMHHEGGEKDAQGMISPVSWRKTGCLYSMPQIRYRPSYPLIPRDGMADVGGQVKRGTGCGKYYSEYGQKRLTGGIMVVWCTHGVCYGFHCIPTSEGRNEVFSAIYTHWEKAPDIVVYDYACNLAPYMMAREPAFFANTKCLIDHFHSMGHTACGNACRLMTYVITNPDLDKINSSAAECGNSGIVRIRKSVSYMTQDHAIIYTKIFFSMRNRLILRRQEKEGRRH